MVSFYQNKIRKNKNKKGGHFENAHLRSDYGFYLKALSV